MPGGTGTSRTTETLYDPTGNKLQVKFPDLTTQRWEDYDAFGQPGKFFNENNNLTDLIYCWGPMKKLYKVIAHRDAKPVYRFSYFRWDFDAKLSPMDDLQRLQMWGSSTPSRTAGPERGIDLYDARGARSIISAQA